jgi:hypothetical protein
MAGPPFMMTTSSECACGVSDLAQVQCMPEVPACNSRKSIVECLLHSVAGMW